MNEEMENAKKEFNEKIQKIKDALNGKIDIDIPVPEEFQKVLTDIENVLTEDNIKKITDILKNNKNKDEN